MMLMWLASKLEHLGIKGLVSFCHLGKEAIVYSTLLDMPFPEHAFTHREEESLFYIGTS